MPFKGSLSLKFVFHPQGTYLATINEFKIKKNTQYAVEIFELRSNDCVPHQQIQIERQVIEFRNVHWEPNHTKLAIHTLAKKENEGKREYTSNPTRDGVDIYEMVHDKETKSFVVKTIGKLNNDRIVAFSWAPCGDIFTACERDGTTINSKKIWGFYMIDMREEQKKDDKPAPQIIRGKGGKA